MKVSPNAACPCGRKAKLKACCGRIFAGSPPDPESLMRARFTAYATNKVRFLIETTHPEATDYERDLRAWTDNLRDYCRTTQFLRLTVHEVEVQPDSDVAFVRFTAEIEQGGRSLDFTERSRFSRDGKRWKYISGELQTQATAER